MKLSKISRNNRQVIILMTASIMGMLFGIINSAINTNYLDPISYGDVRYVQNIINFFSSILLLGFFVSGSRLLAISKHNKTSRDIRGGMIIILSVTIIILMLIMAVFSFLAYKDNEIIMRDLYIIAIPTCGNVLLLNYINTTAQGDNHIVRIAFARVLPAIIYLIIALPVFKYYSASPQIMLALFNGSAVIILSIIIISTKPCFNNIPTALKELYQENKKYGIHVYFGSLAGVSTAYITGITLGHFCGNNANVGFYTLALTLSTPLTLLPSIIGTAYFKTFANQYKISFSVLKASIVLTLVCLIIFQLGISIVVDLVYPKPYRIVSSISCWLAIGTSFHGLGDMFNRFLGSHGQGKQIRNASYACGLVTLIGSVVLVYYIEITGAVITRILSSFTYMFLMILYYIKYIRIQSRLKDLA